MNGNSDSTSSEDDLLQLAPFDNEKHARNAAYEFGHRMYCERCQVTDNPFSESSPSLRASWYDGYWETHTGKYKPTFTPDKVAWLQEGF